MKTSCRISKQEQTYIKVRDVESILEEIHKLDHLPDSNDEIITIKTKIESIVNKIYYVPAKEVLEEVFKGKSRLAKDLQKNEPKVAILGCQYGISDSYEELFNRIFVHLLRNSLYHGIEDADLAIEKVRTREEQSLPSSV